MAIEGVNNNANVLPQAPLTTPEKIQEVIDEVAPLFGGDTSLNVDETRRVDDTKEKTDLSDVPEIDDADLELLKGVKADLEALVALLQAEQDEKTLEAVKARIESLKGQMSAHHDATMKKVNETIDEIKEQEKAALANKILGWLGVAVALVVAAVLVCTVGGAAAAVAVVGAVFGATMATLNETGVMEKLVKAISESLQKDHPGWSKEACDAWAQGIVAGIQIAISLALAVGGGFASAGTGLVKVSDAVMKGLKIGMAVTNSVMQAGSLAGSATSMVYNYKAADGQADVTEMQALMLKLQKMMDEESDELKKILTMLNDALGELVELLEAKQQTLNEINQGIGA